MTDQQFYFILLNLSKYIVYVILFKSGVMKISFPPFADELNGCGLQADSKRTPSDSQSLPHFISFVESKTRWFGSRFLQTLLYPLVLTFPFGPSLSPSLPNFFSGR